MRRKKRKEGSRYYLDHTALPYQSTAIEIIYSTFPLLRSYFPQRLQLGRVVLNAQLAGNACNASLFAAVTLSASAGLSPLPACLLGNCFVACFSTIEQAGWLDGRH